MGHDIVYFHIGDSNYLLTSIKQLKYFNPSSNIYLIGRDVPPEAKTLVKFIDYEELIGEQSKIFLQNFANYSTNDANFEKICILRWFLIRNMCKRENIERFFCLDSDVMVYCDLDSELKKFDSNRYALTHWTSAGIACINDISVLDDYCNFVIGFYDDSLSEQHFVLREDKKKTFEHFRDDILYAHFNRSNNGLPGGVCDMTFWGELRKIDAPTMIGEISGVFDGTTFDHNIHSKDFFDYKNGMKNIVWKDGLPYCKNLFLNEMVRFNILHFQGYHSKRLMENFKTYK